MEHSIEIDEIEDQQEARSDEGQDQKSNTGLDDCCQEIMQGIDCLPPLHTRPCIFKVHDELRHVNKKAYMPILLSIGPYHHGNPKFLAMEVHKKRYLDSLLKRTNQNVYVYLRAMSRLEHKARECYADPIPPKVENFVKMMLLDACFVIEFLRKNGQEELRDKDDPIFNASWMDIQIYCDLMLLENQLPFFVLSELYYMTPPSITPLTILAFPLINYMGLGDPYFTPREDLKKSVSKRKHLLDLVRNVSSPSVAYQNKKPCTKVPCVIELQEAGVEFKVKEYSASLFDISFEPSHGQLKIPKMEVFDSTEAFLCNIIAYEQHSFDAKQKYFTDYVTFLDLLINTEADVKELRCHKIIDHLLGDDIKVARMFNRLGSGVIISSDFFYSKICDDLNVHCGKCWNNSKAKLRRKYFNSPWATVSTIAASFLLLFTLIQTVVALITLLS